MNVSYRVDLEEDERGRLEALVAGGSRAVRRAKRARILLAAAAGQPDDAIACTVLAPQMRVFRQGRLQFSRCDRTPWMTCAFRRPPSTPPGAERPRASAACRADGQGARGESAPVETVPHAGTTPRVVAVVGCCAAIGSCPREVRRVGWRYSEQGGHVALTDEPGPKLPKLLDSCQQSAIVAMVGGLPPVRCAHWTVRLATSLGTYAGICAESRLTALLGMSCVEAAGSWFGVLAESLGETPAENEVKRAAYADVNREPRAAGTNLAATLR